MLLSIDNYDNLESVRAKKYATATHVVLQESGVQTGQTPREVVWEEDEVKLYRYEVSVEKRFSVPILLVYALILRPYVLDLVPGNSFVEYLVGEGFDVYMLDWGVPGDEDIHLSFEDYVLDYLPEAVEQVLENSRAEDLSLFGTYQGGTMSAVYAALFPRVAPKNLILLATPTGFAPQDFGFFGSWDLPIKEYLGPNLLIKTFGDLPADRYGSFVEATARAQKPFVDALARPHGGLWPRAGQYGYTDSFLAASKWVDDGVPFPGEALRQWIRDFYQQNKLARGELELGGHRVDLSNIECPILNIAGSKDFVCPASQAEATMGLVGSQDKEFLVLDAGHVGLMCGPLAKKELWPRIRDWLGPRSD